MIIIQNKIVNTTRELLAIDADLPARLDYSTGEVPTVNDFELFIFEQLWGSTALGFKGVGGQAMTTANTYVFVPVCVNQKCFVYFAGQFAYAVPYSQIFIDDVRKCDMESVARSGKYLQSKEN